MSETENHPTLEELALKEMDIDAKDWKELSVRQQEKLFRIAGRIFEEWIYDKVS